MADEPAYRFTPVHEGDFLRGVPTRDLTQVEVDALAPDLRRDALSPHPLYGQALYTPVTDADADQPKWWLARVEQAAETGIVLVPRLSGESQRAYDERTAPAPAEPDVAAGDAGEQDGEA